MTAEKDIPERRLQLREAELVISGILSRIERKGEPDPARLTLRASVVSALRGLIETRSGVEAATQSAEGELSEVRRRLDEVLAKLEQTGGGQELGLGRETRISSLVATVAALRADDHAARAALPSGLAQPISRPWRIGSASCGPGRVTSSNSSNWRSPKLALSSAGR